MHRGGDFGRYARVCLRERDISSQTAPAGERDDARQDVGRHRLTLHAILLRLTYGGVDEAAHVVRGNLVRLGHGIADEDTAAEIESPLRFEQARDFAGSVEAERRFKTATAAPEGGKLVGGIADHGHAAR